MVPQAHTPRREAQCVVLRRDRVLFIWRKDHASVGRWGLPGGPCRQDETPVQTLSREMKTGLGISDTPTPQPLGEWQTRECDVEVYALPFTGHITNFDAHHIIGIIWLGVSDVIRFANSDRLALGFELEAVNRAVRSDSTKPESHAPDAD